MARHDRRGRGQVLARRRGRGQALATQLGRQQRQSLAAQQLEVGLGPREGGQLVEREQQAILVERLLEALGQLQRRRPVVAVELGLEPAQERVAVMKGWILRIVGKRFAGNRPSLFQALGVALMAGLVVAVITFRALRH